MNMKTPAPIDSTQPDLEPAEPFCVTVLGCLFFGLLFLFCNLIM
jgi:hypothetical protein